MTDFSWIPQIAPRDWSEVLRGKRYVRMSRSAFVQRCGSPGSALPIDAFWAWAMTQSRSYALVWDVPLEPDDDILIVVRETPR